MVKCKFKEFYLFFADFKKLTTYDNVIFLKKIINYVILLIKVPESFIRLDDF